MAVHYKVTYLNGESVIHLDGVNQAGDVSICGSDLMGDEHLGWHPAEVTDKKVNCRECLAMFNYFKRVSITEFSLKVK